MALPTGFPSQTYVLDMATTSWVPYSGAALASGAVALVLGSLSLPSSPDGYALLQNAQLQDGRWIMASVAYLLCAVGLNLGLPTFLYLLPDRGRRIGMVGTAVFGVATMGMAAYGALLIFFRALVKADVLGQSEVGLLAKDHALLAFAAAFLVCFYLGEVLFAVALVRARTVPRWVPVLFLLHAVLLPFNLVAPGLQTVQTGMIGIAFMGVAVYANDQFDRSRDTLPRMRASRSQR